MTLITFISINPANMTKFIKKDQINSNWFEIDAENAVVGRLATYLKLLEENVKYLHASYG